MGHLPIYLQLLVGLSFGFGTGMFAVFLVNLPLLKETNNFYTNLISAFNLNIQEILFISFCAGVGEEVLFRGALQPLFGLWLVAVVFVAIHGYLNPFDWKISIYGLYMVLVAAGFGYLFSGFGIIAASAAHFAFDVVMLLHLSSRKV
jgi:membrane protease YdiL (CAAX protease family)